MPLDASVTAAMFPPDPLTKMSSLITTLRSHWNPDLPPDAIELTAYPVIGRGRDFMGFCPVACCAFENTRDEDPVRQESFFHEWLASFKKITDPTSIEPAQLENYRAEWKTMAIQRCFKVNESGQPASFSFVVESVGVRPVRDLIAEGIQAVIDLVKPYTDDLPLKDLGLTILPLESRMSGLRVIFDDQEHTLGCLLEAMIHELYLDTEAPDAPISYVAYKVPHPLQKKMVLTLGEAGTPLDETVVKKIVVAAAQRAITIFQGLAKAWSS
jgi:DNA-directed RNA polymerase subunit L